MMMNVVHEAQARAVHALQQPARAPFKCAPVMLPDPERPKREEQRKCHVTSVASWLYINRLEGADHLGTLPPAYMEKRDDLVAHGRRHPIQRIPTAYTEGRLLWDEADRAAVADPSQASAMHIILTLPPIARHRWQPLVERFLDDHLVARGMIVDFAIHALLDEEGGWKTAPHCHALATARRWRPDQRKGVRQRSWLGSKAQVEALEGAWLAASGLPPRAFVLA